MEILIERGYVDFIRLDSGGQANVYKTMKDGKQYAIKVVQVDLNKPQAKLDKDLKRELTIMHGLRHPNCMAVVDLFRTRIRVYIVMNFMPNGNIGNRVRKSGPLCEWNVKCWWPPIVRAVRYLHLNKIAHRDLKLDNILLDQHFNPIVSDFGFSRFIELDDNGQQLPLNETFCGTLSHHSPQMLMRQPYLPFGVDVWCLGIMFFIMLNQKYPFEKREGKQRMYQRQMEKDYHLKPEIKTKVSQQATQMIDFLLEPNQTLRPNVDQICQHPWFPIAHLQLELKEQLRKKNKIEFIE
ncbi:hypothetical protein RDWZM_007547 [Blomia tropicalis]|uniref:Protein kinase domain-containing protein n=1 Tax=Blomia tropicalis TaxID=40697 RepID=A0A9Q0LZC1_BLOTA|nr:hypothetical protein BLOT_014748 [Blomia tropicalis]KAJ6216390.1 hypothetical protein RDWZM_007547 [Blomia tropicalis]